jgi:hypothetical protein
MNDKLNQTLGLQIIRPRIQFCFQKSLITSLQFLKNDYFSVGQLRNARRDYIQHD